MPTSSTKNYTAQDLLNAVGGEHNAIADANGIMLLVGGVYKGTPTAVADGDLVRQWGNAYGYQIPERQNLLVGSLTNQGTTTTAVLGTLLGLGAFKEMDVLVDVTGTVGSTATMDIYVDSRLDGTTWVNIAHGATHTTASVQALHLTKNNPPTSILVTALAGVGTVRAIGWGDDIQVRYTIGGATSQFSFRVWANVVG